MYFLVLVVSCLAKTLKTKWRIWLPQGYKIIWMYHGTESIYRWWKGFVGVPWRKSLATRINQFVFVFWGNKHSIEPNEKENHWLYPCNVLKIRVLSLTFGEFSYSYRRSSFLFAILIRGVGLMSNQIWKNLSIQGWEKSKRPSNNLQLNKSRKLQLVFIFYFFNNKFIFTVTKQNFTKFKMTS